MKHLTTILLVLAAVLSAACSASDGGLDTTTLPPASGTAVDSEPAAPATALPAAVAPSAPAGRYIVGLAAAGDKGASAVNRMTAALATPPDYVYDEALTGFAGQLTAAEVARLSADPDVSFVEPDIVFHADAQTLGWGVNRVDAELNTRWIAGTGGAGVTVAVFDTGIDVWHPDLQGAVLASYNATGGGSIVDGNGHGTHVAGIIAARRNLIGTVGVAPSSRLLNVKVLGDDGAGNMSWIIAGINWVMARRAYYNVKVANLSLGAAGSSTALETAINNATAAGLVFVAAAGNEGVDASGVIPASYSNVICVSALNTNGSFASYSNYGSVVDIAAPGTQIPSLWRGGGYAYSSGTSMATPHVAGALALWYDNHSGGLATAKAALQNAGESGTWSGDPDGFREKLLDAQGL